MGTLRFKSKEGYRKWLAFGHIHKVFEKVKGHQKIVLGGKAHKVKHTGENKMRFAVKGHAFKRGTLRPIGKVRTEIVRTGGIFAGAKTPTEVKRRYEAFWNDLNPHSAEIVKVLSVRKVGK